MLYFTKIGQKFTTCFQRPTNVKNKWGPVAWSKWIFAVRQVDYFLHLPECLENSHYKSTARDEIVVFKFNLNTSETILGVQ